MARVCGACCGLLVFSAMIVCGMLAGNPVPSIVTRALLGLLGGFILGSLSGWIGLYIVRENVRGTQGDEANTPPAELGEAETPRPERNTESAGAIRSMPTVR